MDPRHPPGQPTTRARAVLVVALVVVATLFLPLQTTTGAPGPASATAADPSQDIPTLPPECVRHAIIPPVPIACHLTPYRAKRPTVVLWGDSHAWQYIPAIRNAAIARGANLTAFVLGGCPPVKVPIDRAPRNPKSCATNNYLAMKYVMRLQKGDQDVRVLLGSHWAGYRRAARESTVEPLAPFFGYDETTQGKVELFQSSAAALFPALGRVGVDVDVIGQTATVPRVTLPCAAGDEPYSCDVLRARAIYDEDETEAWLRERMQDLAGSPRLIDVNSAYCGQLMCRGIQDGIHTFYDDLHLSATRTDTLTRFFVPTMRALR